MDVDPGPAARPTGPSPPGRRTVAQRAGDAAEAHAEAALLAAGWEILGRRLRVGRAELDLVAVDPGPPRMLVAVEVRWRSGRGFGLPEETVDRRKITRLWGAVGRLLEEGRLPDGSAVPRLPARLDLVAAEPGPSAAAPRLRHHRGVGRPGGDGTLW